MVKLHIKKGDEDQFLIETTVQISVEDLMKLLIPIYNGRLKVNRICSEIEMLAESGASLPPNMQGLTEEQVEELRLVDEWTEKCSPSGGYDFKRDVMGRRNGRSPSQKMKDVLLKTVKEAKEMISKKKIGEGVFVTQNTVDEALSILRGAVTIVYPMNLPPHDPIRMEFENVEDLAGTQASLEILNIEDSAIWWAGKEFQRGKNLQDYVGKNEKTKILCKLQKRGGGPPAREPVVNEDERKAMMSYYYKKQEEFKKLEKESDDEYLNSDWCDNNALKRQFQGMTDIKWKSGFR
ncbi:unnamed protein product [Dimorphilus gyrociliatus]|uniref:Uncharacterized protein n=1 Tax=Dimorphilus gyrociliatus TaxID=2664684 RepID=A0A7I8VBJ9_9ANNE|nr:unnamed protein product [Dimorphilus gyrociliatus]